MKKVLIVVGFLLLLAGGLFYLSSFDCGAASAQEPFKSYCEGACSFSGEPGNLKVSCPNPALEGAAPNG